MDTHIMPELEQAVPCPLKGFECVVVHFNMLAPEKAADAITAKAGREGSDKGVVALVDGWDADKYGADPWDYETSPMAFRMWAAKRGYRDAIIAFVTDPNL